MHNILESGAVEIVEGWDELTCLFMENGLSVVLRASDPVSGPNFFTDTPFFSYIFPSTSSPYASDLALAFGKYLFDDSIVYSSGTIFSAQCFHD